MSQSYQIQQKTVSNSSTFSEDLNENNNENLLLINDEAFSPNWMNDEIEKQDNSSFPLPRVVARMPQLTFSDTDKNQSPYLGKAIFVMLASRKKRWVSIFGCLALIVLGLGIWKNKEPKTELPLATDENPIESVVAFDSDNSYSNSNGLGAMTSNAITSMSDQQNAFPADYSINIENDQNNDILTALNFDETNSSDSVYSSHNNLNSESDSSFNRFSMPDNHSKSLENSVFEPRIPDAFNSPENVHSSNYIPSSYQSNVYSPQSGLNQQMQYEENPNSTNTNAIWINDVPFDYSETNQRSNSYPSNNQANAQNDLNVQNNWNSLQNEPLLNNNELNQRNTNQAMKNSLQRFTPTSQNTQDVRFNSTPNNYPNQYNTNNQNTNINQGNYSPVPNQGYQGNNSMINYSSSNQGFSQYRH